MTCQASIKTGKRQGKICDRVIKTGSMCGYHRLKSDNDGRKTPKLNLHNRSIMGSVSSSVDLNNKFSKISKILNQQGAILIWKCMCGRVIYSNTVQLNRQNIYLGLGVPKKSKYETCSKCFALMCARCISSTTVSKICSECTEHIKENKTFKNKSTKRVIKRISKSIPKAVAIKSDEEVKKKVKKIVIKKTIKEVKEVNEVKEVVEVKEINEAKDIVIKKVRVIKVVMDVADATNIADSVDVVEDNIKENEISKSAEKNNDIAFIPKNNNHNRGFGVSRRLKRK